MRRHRCWISFTCLRLMVVVGVVGTILPGHVARGSSGAESRPGATASPKETAPGQPAVLAVEAVAAVTQPIQRAVQVVGSFAGYDEVGVMAEVSGRVVQVLHDVGDVVRPGDILLKIDPTDYELAVQEIRRSLELDATRLGVEPPPEDQFKAELIMPMVLEFDISKLPSVVRAVKQEGNANSKLERARQLVQRNSISKEEYEEQEMDYEVAFNTRIQTERDARAVLAGIKQRLVLLRIADERLRRTSVVVPTPTRRQGMPDKVEYSVAQRKVTEGEMLKDSPGASTATFDLVMDAVLKFNATVPERYIADVKVGQSVLLHVEAYPGREFTGRVSRVSPVVDRLSRAFHVEASVPNALRELRPGGFAKADILSRIDPNAVTVPLAAVYTFVGSTRVFTVRDGQAHAVAVTTGVELPGAGPDQRGWVELTPSEGDQIRPGTLVITTGHTQLAEGVPVQVRQTVPASEVKAPPSPRESAER